MNKREQVKIKQLIQRWNNSGRVAVLYPRLKQVAINGRPRVSINEAMEYMETVLCDDCVQMLQYCDKHAGRYALGGDTHD